MSVDPYPQSITLQQRMTKVGTINTVNERNRALNDKPTVYKRQHLDSSLAMNPP
jgi:hypothetical protein